MTDRPHYLSRLRAAFDADHALALLQRAVAAQSVTGAEANMAVMLQPEMARLGLNPIAADFLPGRPNIRGTRVGTGGPHLLFMGHTDTVSARGWADHWAGSAQQDPFGGAVIDGQLWGRGAADLKAGICASLAALDLIDRAGLRLKGTVSYAFVGDEESGEPSTGVSAGVRAYTAQVVAGDIPRPDFAIYVEPTQLQVLPVQIGFFIADITILGRSAYFGRPELGVDALKATHAILSAIWAHSDAIAARSEHPLLGRAFALVTDISGGGMIAVPGECRLSLIRKLLPDEDLETAALALEAVIKSATPPAISVKIEWPAGRDHARGGSAAETAADHPAVQRLSEFMAAAKPGAGQIAGAHFWSEMPFLTNQIGCPAVYCAPGDISICHTFEERVPFSDYNDGIVALAAFIADFCGITEA
jgi:acetylornithine deacetylase